MVRTQCEVYPVGFAQIYSDWSHHSGRNAYLPLRDRFGVINRLELYSPEELKQIVLRSAGILNVEIDDEGAYEIARRSRGTPRVTNRLLKRVGIMLRSVLTV